MGGVSARECSEWQGIMAMDAIGRAGADESRELAEHLEHCEECRGDAADVRSAAKALTLLDLDQVDGLGREADGPGLSSLSGLSDLSVPASPPVPSGLGAERPWSEGTFGGADSGPPRRGGPDGIRADQAPPEGGRRGGGRGRGRRRRGRGAARRGSDTPDQDGGSDRTAGSGGLGLAQPAVVGHPGDAPGVGPGRRAGLHRGHEIRIGALVGGGKLSHDRSVGYGGGTVVVRGPGRSDHHRLGQ